MRDERREHGRHARAAVPDDLHRVPNDDGLGRGECGHEGRRKHGGVGRGEFHERLPPALVGAAERGDHRRARFASERGEDVAAASAPPDGVLRKARHLDADLGRRERGEQRAHQFGHFGPLRLRGVARARETSAT